MRLQQNHCILLFLKHKMKIKGIQATSQIMDKGPEIITAETRRTTKNQSVITITKVRAIDNTLNPEKDSAIINTNLSHNIPNNLPKWTKNRKISITMNKMKSNTIALILNLTLQVLPKAKKKSSTLRRR